MALKMVMKIRNNGDMLLVHQLLPETSQSTILTYEILCACAANERGRLDLRRCSNWAGIHSLGDMLPESLVKLLMLLGTTSRLASCLCGRGHAS